MTRLEYDFLRDQRPELFLPPWTMLWESEVENLSKIQPQELVARASALILVSEGRHSIFIGSKFNWPNNNL